MSQETKPSTNFKGRALRVALRVLLPIVIIGIGVALAKALIETAPKAPRQPPPRMARLVELETVQIGNHRAVVSALGTVQPAREVTLQSRVSGQVAAVSNEFVPGGCLREGVVLLQIDKTDFELAVRHRESEVAQARMELALELGQQEIARREFEMLGATIKDGDRSLMLRQPQLERVQARLRSAEAALAQARLDLERTTIRAPFNATVRGRTVNLGMYVTPNTSLATLTGTDLFWIEASLPVDQLQWIQIPQSTGQSGSTVKIFNEAAWGSDVHRTGRVIRLLTDLDRDGRMARVLIEVQDPLALMPANSGKPRLLINDFVRLEIEGINMPNVAAVKRHLVRDGDRVWIMNQNNELEIRKVEIAFSGRDLLFLRSGISQGERIVVTELASPVQGMPLRTAEKGRDGDRRPPGEGKKGMKGRPPGDEKRDMPGKPPWEGKRDMPGQPPGEGTKEIPGRPPGDGKRDMPGKPPWEGKRDMPGQPPGEGTKEIPGRPPGDEKRDMPGKPPWEGKRDMPGKPPWEGKKEMSGKPPWEGKKEITDKPQGEKKPSQ